MKLHFHGAAGGVTGSKHIVEAAGKRILLDCGMFQGRRKQSYELNKKLPFDAKTIDAVLLSHGHIDHSGLLPLLVKSGFKGPIYCTPGTAAVVEPLLLDSAHIQESDAKYFSKKRYRDKSLKMPPLYSKADAEETLHLLQPKPRHQKFTVAGEIQAEFYNAGHVLGSAQVYLEADGHKLLFTGDLGSRNKKILRNPEQPEEADIIITESTYGGRRHKDDTMTREELSDVVKRTAARGGKVIIPSFALERTQEVLYDLHLLYNKNCVPPIPVFVDSPLATKFTRIFEKRLSQFNENTYRDFIKDNENPFSFNQLKHTVSTNESKALNHHLGPCIIISASGMCEGGRIRHHLRNSLEDARNTLLIVGYQAAHTLGRKLVRGDKMVKIFDRMYSVKMEVVTLGGYSGHGDQIELRDNIKAIKGVKKIFIVHGEPDQSAKFKDCLQAVNKTWQIETPKPGDDFTI